MSGLSIYTQKFVTVKEINVFGGALSADLDPQWLKEEPKTSKTTDEVTYTYPENTLEDSTEITNFEEAEKISFCIQKALISQPKFKKAYSFSVLEDVTEDEFSPEKAEKVGVSLLRPSNPTPDYNEEETLIRGSSRPRQFESWQELESHLIQPSSARQPECYTFHVSEEVTEEERSSEKTKNVSLATPRPTTPAPAYEKEEPPIRLGSPAREFESWQELQSYFNQASGAGKRQRVDNPY
jgi:hypothetical protein